MATSTSSEKGQNIARTHTNQSKRKAREKVESKPAFKNVLYNPFEVKWYVSSFIAMVHVMKTTSFYLGQ